MCAISLLLALLYWIGASASGWPLRPRWIILCGYVLPIHAPNLAPGSRRLVRRRAGRDSLLCVQLQHRSAERSTLGAAQSRQRQPGVCHATMGAGALLRSEEHTSEL